MGHIPNNLGHTDFYRMLLPAATTDRTRAAVEGQSRKTAMLVMVLYKQKRRR